MANAEHYVIIGNGMAGNAAAAALRERDPESRVTIVSAGALLFYNRYDLTAVFQGCESWVDLLVHPPEYYEEQRITLRRKSLVNDVDSKRQVVLLAHREVIHYDELLVATGGEAYLPEKLKDARHLMHYFNTFRAARDTRAALPEGSHAIILGGDVLGLDLARNLVKTGRQVSLVPDERTFWPHTVAKEDRPRYYAALEKMGIEICAGGDVDAIEEGAPGLPARRLVFSDGTELRSDVVMPFYGLAPNVDFMSGSGVDMERGILVDGRLKSSTDGIWAAGDVCQIWSPELNGYRFYYGYRNVRRMGEIAARNMTGETVDFEEQGDESLQISDDGLLYSPLWEHD